MNVDLILLYALEFYQGYFATMQLKFLGKIL